MADYSYMQQPKVKTQSSYGVQGVPSTLREVGGSGKSVTTYDQPRTQTPTVGTLPPAPNYPAGPTNPMPSAGNSSNSGNGWNLGPWNQATTTTMPNKNTPLGTSFPQGNQAVQWGGEKGFFGGDPNIFNPFG